nr:acetate uptake transporter [uncultured Acetobacter sp.]
MNNVKLYANPAPLGLMGFGMTTVLLNLHNAGLVSMGSAILAMGLVFGGLAQIFAGILEFFNGNTFGLTAFTSYGAFWISFVLLIVLPHFGAVSASSPSLIGSYLVMWGIFTAVLFVATLKAGRELQVVFATLVILFLLLAAGEFTGQTIFTTIAGFEGLICGFSAIYLAGKDLLEA